MSRDKMDIGLIAIQQRQMLDGVNRLREDIRLMMAILQRLDGTVVGLVNEVRAEHSRFSRMDSRVRSLEG